MSEVIVYQTKLTVVLFGNGTLLIPKDENGAPTFFPKYVDCIRRGDSNNVLDGKLGALIREVDGWNEINYTKKMAELLTNIDKRCSRECIEKKWIIPDPNGLTDMGNLTSSIYSGQVHEMITVSDTVGYIRDGIKVFKITPYKYEHLEYRYLVLPSEYSVDDFRDSSAYSIEELEKLIEEHPGECTSALKMAMKQLDESGLRSFIKEMKRLRNDSTRIDNGEYSDGR